MQPKITGPEFFIGRGNDTLISFGSGQPDLPPPDEAFAILKDFRGQVQGNIDLREALSAINPGSNPEEFVITNGASEAIDLALRAIAQPGARVLMARPYYYSYPRNVELAGMTPVYIDLDADGKIPFDTFEKEIRTCRAVILNSPSNPAGTVQDMETLKKIETLCDELGVYILSDEVYKDLIYTRENYPLHGERVITLDSFSKTYAMCGLRVGFLHSPDMSLVQKVIEMKSHTAMNTSIVSQAMALAALGSPKSYVANYKKVWIERRDLMYEGLCDLGLELFKPEGAFYLLPKFKESGKVVHDLYYNYQMITYDGAWFGAPGRVRFSYALEVAKIQEGLKRLGKFLENEYRAY
jgi:aspartate/methionine/tyrosine aminotransferase